MEYQLERIGAKSVLWIGAINKYLMFGPAQEPLIEKAIFLAKMREAVQSMGLDFGLEQDDDYDEGLETLVDWLLAKPAKAKRRQRPPANPQYDWEFTYTLFHRQVLVQYSDQETRDLIHPKFSHLVTLQASIPNDTLQCIHQGKRFFLAKNGQLVGSWGHKDIHFFTGRFSMLLQEILLETREEQCTGVFHASSLARNGHGMLITGDSGSGKSTLAAILMAAGWDLYADDFAPLTSPDCFLVPGPAAISVKSGSVEALLPWYPQLAGQEPHQIPGFDKQVRYIQPRNNNLKQMQGTRCSHLLFVKYLAGAQTRLEALPAEEAFKRLVPDAWLSPLPANARCFLDWFLTLRSYSLTYSDAHGAISELNKITE